MSRKCNCFDNTVIERFLKIFKTERLHNVAIINHEAVVGLAEKYIRYYNYKRRHSDPEHEHEHEHSKILDRTLSI